MNLKEKIELLYDELVTIRRDFHRHPELSGKEYRTGEQICQYLAAWGIEYEAGVADTGVVGIIRGKAEGKTIGIRADIDALPIQEPTDLAFHSLNDGVMHACGHDMHTTIMLGAAKLLKEMENQLVGNVKLFFQPAEETIGGADRMIKAGCLKNPNVDHVIGLHVMPNIPTGKVELKYGKLNGNSGGVTIEVIGESGHAAYPEKSIDAVVMASAIVTNLQTLVSRNVSPLNSTVLTFGKINGGQKANIIADKVVLDGTLRAIDTPSRQFAKDRIKKIAESVAEGFGGKANVIFKDGYVALINDDFVTDVVKAAAIEVVGQENIVYKEFPSMGGEDFSYFTEQVPSAFFHLGCAHDGENFPLHSKHFVANEACIKIGVEMEVKTVLKLLES